MTAQVLVSELAILIQETKRKNPDIRIAAEKSLSELKALPYTSEAQLAAGIDLRRRPNFVRPFLLACVTRNPRYAGTAIVCLQRLVVSNGLAQETLKDVLDVVRDCSSLGLDIQLKILQALPPLLQNYAVHLTGTLLASALHICFLLNSSKTPAISNTAAATLQQLVVSVLGKVTLEDDNATEESFIAEVPTEDGTLSVRGAALDAYHLLNDICLLTEGQKPEFLHSTSIPASFGLELIEAMLSNHSDTVSSHPEQVHILRLRLMPFILRVLSEKVLFSVTVRAMRLLPLIFENMLNLLSTECEMVLGLLNHMLDPDAAVLWKRVLCMEVYKSLHTQPSLIRSIYAHFDEADGGRNIIRDNLAIMVRLASEKPSIIGIGQQSSMPASSQPEDEIDEQAALQAEGVAGTIGMAMTLKSSGAPGISSQFSTMRVPCIDQLDKSEPPTIPQAYLYSLALVCINSFSDGLAKFLLPFSMPSEARTRRKPRQPKDDEEGDSSDQITNDGGTSNQSSAKSKLLRSQSISVSRIPVNPLNLESHVLYEQIRTSANMVDSCWPALLAAYSTFFHAALDSEYYHALVRSFQKFSQISGLLRLSTPRDAFLTTLGKNAVPPAAVSAIALASSVQSSDRRDPKRRASGFQENESSLSPIVGAEKGRQSLEISAAGLNTRNLLCLRALLNLGIALGPILETGWSIVFETLQQANSIISQLTSQRRQRQNGSVTPTTPGEATFPGDLGSEIAAVNLAAMRLLESSTELPDKAFVELILSLKSLLRDMPGDPAEPSNSSVEPSTPTRLQPHHRAASISGTILGLVQDSRANSFVVDNISKLIAYNATRLLGESRSDNGWDIIVDVLINLASTKTFESNLRIHAANALSDLYELTVGPNVPEDERDGIRNQGLVALSRQVMSLYGTRSTSNKASKSCEHEMHLISLEALRSSLEQVGDSLVLGWEHVFLIIASVFEDKFPSNEAVHDTQAAQKTNAITRSKSPKLVRVAFGSLQLICSDFLPFVPPACIAKLLLVTHSFCDQQDDFNISLTSTTLFWNISNYLWRDNKTLLLEFTNIDVIEQIIGSASVDTVASAEAGRYSEVIMWVHLLLLLVETTVDERLEIRHSALHTIFRILDACGSKLRSSDWIICQRLITIRIFIRNDAAYRESRGQKTNKTEERSTTWNETSITMLDNLSSLYVQYLQAMLHEAEFDSLWEALGTEFQRLLRRESLDLSAALYNTIDKILSEASGQKEHFASHATLMWDIWQVGNPVAHDQPSSRNQSDNQTALLAYLRCLTEIYQFIAENLELEQISIIFKQLKICATGSTPTLYSGDVDTMTPLQAQILTCVEMIHPSAFGVESELIRTVSSLVTLAYDQELDATSKTGPTYIAMSKAAMDLLRNYILKYIQVDHVYSSGSVAEAVRSLAIPIRLKHKRKREGKDPPTWAKATLATVAILSSLVPILQSLQIEQKDLVMIWQETLNACNAVISADVDSCTSPSNILDDEDFDTTAFTEMFDLVVPRLGSLSLPDQLRRSFAESLFKNSIIHEPHPDDLPQTDRELLEGLQSNHIGRTQDLPASKRSKISYVIIDKLFDMVASHDGSSERVKLAQATAPYLILRVGIVLKAYVLDQPLRGRMPQPSSQRKELLYIVRKLVDLDSEPKAIPDAPGVVSENKKHIYRVYGLLTKALGVARRDEDMQKALIRAIELVSQDFGV